MTKGARMVMLSLVILLAQAAAVLAQVPSPDPWLIPGLGLSDDQMRQIEDLELAFEEETQPLRLKWRRIRLNLDRLSAAGGDRSRYDAQVDALMDIEAELEKKILDYRTRIRTLLTEDQRGLLDRWDGRDWGRGYGWSPRLGWGRGSRLGPGYGFARGLGWGQGYRWGRGVSRGFGYGWGRGGGWFGLW